jgi:hypothetical protein
MLTVRNGGWNAKTSLFPIVTKKNHVPIAATELPHQKVVEKIAHKFPYFTCCIGQEIHFIKILPDYKTETDRKDS